MISQKIERLTIPGLCQWDKGQQISVPTTKVSSFLNFYATQEKEDGSFLQYKLDEPSYVVGESFKLSIPDDMLESSETIIIYCQKGESISNEIECQAIITLPVTERPRPEDLPVPVKVDTNLLYKAIGECLDQTEKANGFKNKSVVISGAPNAFRSISSLVIEQTDTSVEINKNNQPLLYFDSYNYGLNIVYGEELDGKLKAIVKGIDSYNSPQTAEIQITSPNVATSEVNGNNYKYLQLWDGYNSNPNIINKMISNCGNSKFCGTLSNAKNGALSYPILPTNL